MGLFDLFKKKAPEKASDDFNPFDINSTKDYIRKRVKAENPFATEREINRITNDVLSPKRNNLDRLTADGDLPFGWLYANKDFTQQIQEEYSYFSDSLSNAKSVKEKLCALTSLVKYQEDVKRLCESKGECFAYWASSFVTHPEDMERNARELQHMKDNIETLLEEEKRVNYLRESLPNMIRREPGIIQSELYTYYDPGYKNTISSVLYKLDKEGLIVREKSGRSYKLYIK